MNQEELRAKYNPDGSLLRQMQERMLHLFVAIDDICRRHNIPYWLSGGSMLGAVRHQGFIPWDDDLDIEMFRPDFERLMALLPKELPEDMALQWETTDPNYFFQYAKVRDRNSELHERNGYDRVWKEQGIYVDIFPLERVPRWIHKLSLLTFGHTYKMIRTADDPMKAMKRVRRLVAFNRRFVFPLLRAISKVLCPKYYDFALGIPYFLRSEADDFLPVRRVPFENVSAPIMKEAEKCLAYRYGDYMRLPDNPGSQYHADEVKIY